MADNKEKIEKFLAEVKDEGLNFFKYFKAASGYEKAAIILFVGVVFAAGAILL